MPGFSDEIIAAAHAFKRKCAGISNSDRRRDEIHRARWEFFCQCARINGNPGPGAYVPLPRPGVRMRDVYLTDEEQLKEDLEFAKLKLR